jgi:DNA-binding transcriptional regulator YiaG
MNSHYSRNPITAEIEESLKKKFGDDEFAEAKERAKRRNELAQALRRRRIEMNMDQKAFAALIKTTQQQLSRYEIGENSPTVDRLFEICHYLGLEMIIQEKGKNEVLMRL